MKGGRINLKRQQKVASAVLARRSAGLRCILCNQSRRLGVDAPYRLAAGELRLG